MKQTEATELGAGTGLATAEQTTERNNQGGQQDNALDLDLKQTPPGKDPANPVATQYGPEPFRLWINKRLSDRGATITIKDQQCLVTELTPDFRLRVNFEGAISLIPFEGDYISDVIGQVRG